MARTRTEESNQIKYQNEFNKANYDRVEVNMPKGKKAVIKGVAKAAGQSVSEYINQAKSIQKGGVIMKTWYCVTSSFDNRGRVTANITATKEAETCPESTYTSTSRKDIYNDWFESLDEAQAFAAQSKCA